MPMLPYFSIPMVDVRDVIEAHLMALTHEKAPGKAPGSVHAWLTVNKHMLYHVSYLYHRCAQQSWWQTLWRPAEGYALPRLPLFLVVRITLSNCLARNTRSIRQDPLEAILVIFGRRALIFFLFESSWKKMKNDTTGMRMRSSDHFGDAKMSKRAPRSVEFNFCDRHRQFLQNERRRAYLQNVASDVLIFAKGLSYDL